MIRTELRWTLCAAALAATACGKKPAAAPPPVPVSVGKVRLTDVPTMVAATGTVEPIQTASVQAQVSGQLLHVRFKEGDEVTAGQILFEIDPRQFQASLAQASANLTRDQAQYESSQKDVKRYQALAAKEYVTQQQLDQTVAQAQSQAGTLHADSAAIDQAKLNLQYATVRAPIAGRAGSVLVKEGNQVRGGADQTLVVINQISPILVRFPVQASFFDAVRERVDKGLEVRVSPVGDSSRIEKGTLIFLDNAVDSNTGTVLLKARFANTDGTLWPGALDAVSLQLDVQHNAMVVPTSAVQGGQAGSVVWIVDSSKQVHAVKIGIVRTTDSLTIVSGNLHAGETIVVDGQLRLTEGSKISVLAPRAGGDSTTGTSVIDTSTRKAKGKP
jgi:multidrug efflux system membrane fusion protein